MRIRVREMTAEEAEEIRRLAHSRTEPARVVHRSRILWLSKQGKLVPDIARQLDICQATARQWLKRFNDRGLAGLEEEPRTGRPDTYTPEQVGEVIATALTNPQSLELPFACWTLDRLEAYLNEVKGIPIKYGRRGKGYIFGAFRPVDGEAFTAPYSQRTAVNYVDFLEKVASGCQQR